VEAWHAEAASRGVLFQQGRGYCFHGRARRHLRIGYAALSEQEMSRAVRVLVEAARRVSPGALLTSAPSRAMRRRSPSRA